MWICGAKGGLEFEGGWVGRRLRWRKQILNRREGIKHKQASAKAKHLLPSFDGRGVSLYIAEYIFVHVYSERFIDWIFPERYGKLLNWIEYRKSEYIDLRRLNYILFVVWKCFDTKMWIFKFDCRYFDYFLMVMRK